METQPPEREDEVGAENEESEAADALPGAPAESEAPLGDTDQHSSADA